MRIVRTQVLALCLFVLIRPSTSFLVAVRTDANPISTATRRTVTASPIDSSAPTPLRDGRAEPIPSTDAVVCGGGPAGLMTAIMLAQKYQDRKIKVYDRLSAPPKPDDEAAWNDVAKFYLIGLGGRGQTTLQKFGVWDEVQDIAVAVVGRKDWPPDSEEGVERIFTKDDKRVPTQVLPRDKLVGVLHQHILKNHAGRIELNFGYEVSPIDFDYKDGTSVLMQVAKCTDEVARLNPSSVKTASEEPQDVLCDAGSAVLLSTNLLVAADGTVRTFANAIERADERRYQDMNPFERILAGRTFRVKRYEDDNQRVYKTIPMKLPKKKDWRPDLNYSARTKEGRVTFDALPANSKGDYCGVLLLKKGDPMATADSDPKELRLLLDETLPQFSALLDDATIETVAKKPVSYLPGFRYSGPRLHQGNNCVILGDCAHTVKPYFGLGANSALEDVKILSDILDANEGDISQSVRGFSKRRAADSKALVKISRDLDRPGKLGFVTFILPIILDSIFHGIAPRIFKPNVISMLQREEYSFVAVARTKRAERVAQLTIVAGVLTGFGWTATASVKAVAKILGKKNSTVTGAMLGSIAAGVALRRLAKFLVPGLAPADVLNRVTAKMQDSKTHLTPLRRFISRKKNGSTRNGETFLTPLGFKNKHK